MSDPDKDALLADLRSRVDAVIERDRFRVKTATIELAHFECDGPESFFRGEYVSTPYGRVFVTETRFEPGAVFGLSRLTDYLDADLPALAAWTGLPWLRDHPASDALFFDIETAGATGDGATFAFMTGLGRFEDRAFVVRQVFAANHGDECACLHVIGEALERSAYLVSFNGIAFDAPLLARRMKMHGLDATGLLKPHFDLLAFARRLWRGAFDNCRLVTLEERVVGHGRVGDVPGQLIPLHYAEYLARRDLRRIRAVFDHNVWDIAAMPALAARMAVCAAATDPGADDLTPEEAAAIGRDRKRIGDLDAAVAFLRFGTRSNGKIGRRASHDLTRILKTLRRVDEAVAAWAEMAERQEAEGVFDAFPYIEWSKHLEHWSRNCVEAERIALRGLARCPTADAAAHDDLTRRVARLKWKTRPKTPDGR